MMSADRYGSWSDEDLALLAAGRPDKPEGRAAADALFARYTPVVYRWCFQMVRNPEQAGDLTQEIVLSAYQHLGRFEGWGRFSAWLFVISRRRCLDALRKPALLRDDETELDRVADPGAGPDREAEEREEEKALDLLIRSSLTDEERAALWLRCFEKMPVEAITRVLGIRQTTGARAVLQNARRKLRAALTRADTDPAADQERPGARPRGPASPLAADSPEVLDE